MSLPDELVVLEIFPRVKDVAALLRCAIACKGWRDLLLSKPSFLRRCLPEEACRSSPFAGFFTQQPCPDALPAVACFVPGPRPVMGPRGFLSSMVSGMGDYAVPLTSRHGLLLVRVGSELIVCDPLAGKFDALPRVEIEVEIQWDSDFYFTGYALLTAADCSTSSDQNKDQLPFFKVMIIAMSKDEMYYDLYTYSSSVGESGWNRCSGMYQDEGRNICVTLMQHNAVVCGGGVAHWFFRDTFGFYVLDVCAKTGHVSMSKLEDVGLRNLLADPAYDEPYLSVDAEGRLAFLCLRTDGSRLDIRTCDGDEPDSHIMLELEPPSQKINSLIEQGVVHTCLGEKSGMMIIKDDHQRIYVADVKTGAMQEMTDCPRGHGLSRREIVPFPWRWTGRPC